MRDLEKAEPPMTDSIASDAGSVRRGLVSAAGAGRSSRAAGDFRRTPAG